ncbi:NADH-cytochrome b5 reductase [Pleurotus pulmonarius]|nr:NADH-cytochrome b5 reductase [Pleurotus pulmonarius]KAF4606207.1 NADH-cytochrome b5 reductase [Pleurotus pulmonarius]
MFAARTALRSLTLNGARRYSSTATPASKNLSNLPFYLLGAGVAAAGGYYYVNFSEKAKPVMQQLKSPLDPENFVDFKLKRVEPYNDNTAKFVFELPNNEASLLPVASCLVVKSSDPNALVNDQGKPIIRPYTPISPPDLPGELTLMVKKYDTGNASKYIHSLKEGDSLAIKGPIPKWPYKINEFDEVALIGGGSGVTPLYQILTHALADKTNKTKFTLLFGNIAEKDILLREEFDALKKQFPDKLDVVYFLDKPEASWKGAKGFIGKDAVTTYVAPPTLGEKVKVFVCGPPGQVAALAGKKAGMKQGELGGILKELGYTEDQVYKF